MKHQTKTKLLSIFMALCMVISMVPVNVFAAETDNLCDHHTAHTADCGYVAAVEGAECGHVHDDSCGYKAAVEGVSCACTDTDDTGAVVHTEGCGYVAPVAGSDCTHAHDDTCGYAAAQAEVPCAYECADCAAGEETAAEITGVSITVDGTTYTSGNVTITPTSTVVYTVSGTNFANLSEDNRLSYTPEINDLVTAPYGFTVDAEAGTAIKDYFDYIDSLEKCDNFEIAYSNDGGTTWIGTGIYLTYNDGEASTPITITKQPVSASGKLGETVSTTVEAEGEGLTYQWYFRKVGAETWKKSSVKTDTYSVEMTKARNNRELYCKITDANGETVSTDIVTLTAVPEVKLGISRYDANFGACLGEYFYLAVIAYGDDLTYQWYYRKAGTENWTRSSVRTNVYSDVMTSARHNREVKCVVKDNLGNTVETEIVTLVGIPTTELAIVTQPQDQTVTIGENFNVTFEAVGDGLKYQWYYKNADSEEWRKSGQRDNSYDDVMTKKRHNRSLYCVVTDAWGNTVTTDPIVVIMAQPKHDLQLITAPTDASAKLGEEFCVTLEAQGDELSYRWYWRNAGAEEWRKSGQRDNTYDATMTRTRHNREVYCVITDMWGESITTDVVTITGTPTETLAISGISYTPAAMGEEYCATVEAVGDGLAYTWYFKNEGSEKWTKSSVRDNTYNDTMTKSRVNREVYCVVTDAWGNSLTSDTVTLTVTE